MKFFSEKNIGIDIASKASLVILLLSDWMAGSEIHFYLPLRILAVAGLILPGFHRQPLLWAGIFGVLSFKTYANWWTQDNHQFVFWVWSLVLVTGFSQWNYSEIIARQARWLVGLSFAFATLWKAFLSPDFMNSDYFYFTFLTDARFKEEATLFTQGEANVLAKNTSAMYRVRNGTQEEAALDEVPHLRLAARSATWWTAIIEALLALSFLAPLGWRVSRFRNSFLILFAATTYLIAPVMTFGWTLVCLGLAQTKTEEWKARSTLVLILVLLLLYSWLPVMETFSSIILSLFV